MLHHQSITAHLKELKNYLTNKNHNKNWHEPLVDALSRLKTTQPSDASLQIKSKWTKLQRKMKVFLSITSSWYATSWKRKQPGRQAQAGQCWFPLPSCGTSSLAVIRSPVHVFDFLEEKKKERCCASKRRMRTFNLRWLSVERCGPKKMYSHCVSR